MPSKAEELAVFQRDGWRCRVCGVRVLYPKAVKKLRDLFPAAARWGRSNVDQHSALLVLKASLDHILPHSRGGDNDPLNLVTACYPCQFGRSSWTLEEVGLTDPRLRPPVVNHWDGLVRLMKS
jgi:5-methylcytosine-specific restriction endonuclease McrA